MIYDAQGNIWATPRTIGFRREVQTTSNEVSECITFERPKPTLPDWTIDERPSDPIYRGPKS